jgi:RNA polymerase primary sigma factor
MATDTTDLFRKKLEQLCALARRSGMRLSIQEIQGTLRDVDLNPDQMQMVYDYLDQMGIEVADGQAEDSVASSHGRRPSLEIYLEELDSLTPIPEDVEYLLFERAYEGDREARQMLIERYLTTVCDLAAEFEGRHSRVEAEDLIQEANTGLVMGVAALEKQRSLAGYRAFLLNYVTSFLENSVKQLDELMNSDSRVVNRMNQLADTVRELEEELGHKPSAEELSAFLELPLEDIHGLLRIAGDGLNVGS